MRNELIKAHGQANMLKIIATVCFLFLHLPLHAIDFDYTDFESTNTPKEINTPAATTKTKSFADSSQEYKLYQNDRFGFSIQYPSELVMQAPPDNNDGRTFLSPDGKVEMRAFGSHNAFFETPKEALKRETARDQNDRPLRKNTYRKVTDRSLMLAGIEGKYVFYIERVWTDAGIITLEIRYPESDHKKWIAIVERVSASFHP